MNCNIEIGSVSGLGKRLVQVDIRCLSLMLLFRGVICGARISTVSLRPRGRKTVKTVRIDRVIAATQLKLGVNEKLLSKLLLQVTIFSW